VSKDILTPAGSEVMLAQQMLPDDANPSGDVHATAAYRRHVAGVLAKRVLTEACGA